jgi:poly(3-hydroxybutyrate) depolymerase
MACSSEGDLPDQSGGTGGSGNAMGGSPLGGGGKAAGAPGVGGSAGAGAAGGRAGTTGGTGGTSGTGGTIAGGSGSGGMTSTGGMPSTGGAPVGGSSGSGAMGGFAGPGGNAGLGGAGAGTAGAAGNQGGAGAGGNAAGAGGSGGSGETGRSVGCGKTRTLMNGRKTISSGGNREYILRVPDDYDNNHAYRLVVAYHWLNGNASQVADGGGSTEDPYYGLWDLADNSTIFIAPEGLNAGWANSGGADVKLTDAILDQLEGELCIDTTRIFATGFSYGAGMSYAIACARADVFRGVVLYAGATLSGCEGGNTPIAYMHVHGVNDSVLNISGGRTMRDHYVMINGCMTQSITDVGGNSGTHACTSYSGCSEGHPVRWCSHGGDHNPTEKDAGQSKSWVPGEAWNFISQF